MRHRLFTLLFLIVAIGVVPFSTKMQVVALSLSLPSQAKSSTSAQQFIADVRKIYAQEDFVALDETAFEARIKKERFPGAVWKLEVFYQTLTWPLSGPSATDMEWKAHIERLQRWSKSWPESMTARIALGAAWVEYAKKAQTNVDVWTDFDGMFGGKQYQDRLRQAEKALTFDPAKLMTKFLTKVKTEITGDPKLKAYCPHWYVVKLRIEQGRAWDWNRYNNLFAEGVALEPTYYPLYLIKTADLLPKNHGGQHEWERFADAVARALDGKEGAIAYYLIVAQARSFFMNTLIRDNFFQEHYISWPRLLEGYKQLEATYGTTVVRLNEMALLASLAKEHAVAKVFFDRIGNDFELTVWQERATFDALQNLANGKAAPQQAASSMGGPNRSSAANQVSAYSGWKAILSSSAAAYTKSEDVVIEALIENRSEQTTTVNTSELNTEALSLVILDTRSRKSAMLTQPQINDSSTTNKVLKPGEAVRFTYRIGFSLPAGDYTVKMNSIASNEMLLRIGAPRSSSR